MDYEIDNFEEAYGDAVGFLHKAITFTNDIEKQHPSRKALYLIAVFSYRYLSNKMPNTTKNKNDREIVIDMIESMKDFENHLKIKINN